MENPRDLQVSGIIIAKILLKQKIFTNFETWKLFKLLKKEEQEKKII